MNTVTITGLNRVSKPKPNKAGFTILAHFACQANGFALEGCALVRTPNNGLVAWPPKLDPVDGPRRALTITDDSLRHALMLNAREAYRALGGTDAEWIGSSIPMSPQESAALGERRVRVRRPRQANNEPVDEASGLQRYLSTGMTHSV
ncbi:hypothetical protein AB4Y85_18065 [Microvirga sp. 2YAF29]|uniref:hypothetical protein n=1 Tax=Microvirga sp. 2YAF29 TaxID=3233031 RepID=UPI003F9BFF91